MEHKGLRVTKEILKKKKLTKSIDEVMRIHYGRGQSRHNYAMRYFVPYNLVRTEDLIMMMRDITIFHNFMNDLQTPDPKKLERLAYLTLLTEYVGKNVGESEMENYITLMKNQEFLDRQDEFLKKIKQELATREHVPKHGEKKIIRRLKAQGKYIID